MAHILETISYSNNVCVECFNKGIESRFYAFYAIADLSDREFKDKSEKLYKDTEHFLNILNEKDANSYTFRYPETSSGNLSNFKPNKMIVMDYLKMMMATDSFLCFAVGVLAGTGTLQLGDDILYEMYN